MPKKAPRIIGTKLIPDAKDVAVWARVHGCTCVELEVVVNFTKPGSVYDLALGHEDGCPMADGRMHYIGEAVDGGD